ncbi:MAG: pilus assembly protein PilM [Planctomycetota bacterium]
MVGKAVSVDPGTHTWKVMALKDGKRGLAVARFGAVEASEGAAGLAALGIPLRGAVAGVAGRDMTLRYTQVPPSPDWQLRQLMDLEIQDLAGQSGGNLSADYNLLPVRAEDSDFDVVLLSLVKNDALDQVADVVGEARGDVAGHVPNCIALYNAYIRTAAIDDEDEVVCLANLGNETIDLALVRGSTLLFARNLSGGCKVLDEAIAQSFNVSARKADQLKRDLLDLDPASRGRYASSQAEKVTMAAGGAASAFVSAIQSSVQFCRSQTKIDDLQLDRVLLAGGGAKLRGVRGMLRESLRCPVELFDPFEIVDTTGLPDDDAEQLKELGSEAVVALGLAISRADPQAYSIEILPEAVKRRQRFLQRTVWNIGAGVVGAAVLGFGAVQAKESLTLASTAERRVSVQRRNIEQTHEEAEKLIAGNAADRELTDAFAQRAIPLHGVLRVMRAVRDTLPDEAWLKSIEVQKPGRGRGASPRPLIVAQGEVRAIGGIDVGDAYRSFVQAFREHELMQNAGVVPTSEDLAPDHSTFELRVDLLPDPPEASADADQEQR